MAWSATLKKEDPTDQLRPQVTIVYADATRKDRIVYDVTAGTDMTYFKDIAAKHVAELTAIDAAFATIVEGPLTPLAKVLTPAEVDLNAFLALNEQKLANERAIAAGKFTAIDQKVIDDRTAWSAAFKPGYEKYI